MGRLVSLNVGQPQVIGFRQGKLVCSAIGKQPVDGRRAVRGVNIDGDDQADRKVHGGAEMAVYAYAAEDEAWWATQLGRPIEPGMFGENLTTGDVDCTGAVIGERWRIGTALLEVCQPRTPCFKLAMLLGEPLMERAFVRAGRPGAYLRIIEEGELGAGDAIELVDRPDHGVTIELVQRAVLLDHSLAATALQAPQLADDVRARLARHV